MAKDRKSKTNKIHRRIRKRLSGTADRPRLASHFSNKNVYVQVIDDDKRITLASASTISENIKGKSMSEQSKLLGEIIADKCKSKNIKKVVFDRGGFIFHGKVKTLADSAREKGLEF